MKNVEVVTEATMATKKSPFALYYLSSETSDANMSLRYEGPDVYEEWFLKNATRIEISNDFYKEVILGDPWIFMFFFSRLTNEIEEDEHPESDLKYFVFDFGSSSNLLGYLKKIKTPIANSVEFQHFVSLITRLENEEIKLLGEYNKKLGWFNYDEIMKAKREMAAKSREELNKLGFDYK